MSTGGRSFSSDTSSVLEWALAPEELFYLLWRNLINCAPERCHKRENASIVIIEHAAQ